MESKTESKFSYNLNFLECVNDNLFTSEEVKEHLVNKLKIDGKIGNLKDKVDLKVSGNNVQIISTIKFRKSYLKFLAKKFLFKKNLSDWVRVVSDQKTGYEFAYYKVEKQAEVE